MVLEIRLRNFFSVKDEICIDFRAANTKSAAVKALSNNVFHSHKSDVLKIALMYGANASGKSNIIKAIRFCHAMVLLSHTHNENIVFNFKPFKFEHFEKEPSSYFIRFISNGIEYEYAFSLTQQGIITESLHFYPKGRIKEVFTRDERRGKLKSEIYTFGDAIKRPMDVAENTSNKTLYISRASQMDREIPKEIFHYFHQTFILQYNLGLDAFERLNATEKMQFMAAMQIADSDIVDIQVNRFKQPGKSYNTNLDTLTVTEEETVQEHLRITTYHRADPSKAFDFLAEESQGTRNLFFMMLTILEVVKNNKVLLIDEIEGSIHPKIVEYIFNLFRASEGAQLLCTTHNTQFLDLKKMRKDQIYFVNKRPDASTDVYSLYDYSDFRDTMDLEKAYLQGRFDAVPIVNDSLESLKKLLYEQAE